ncbi:MAG: HIT family protein [Candidatus Eremiobacteraeota bacterium]|nr:HIT family protein [Candidatus Eremiobacteraeota bacterium]
MKSCIFCKILNQEVAAEMVYRDQDAAVFLDHRPLFPGHLLVVPTSHIQTLPELPPDQVPRLFGVVQKMAEAVPIACQAQGTFVALNNKVSQSVPHLHVHVVPRSKKDGLRGFFWPRNPYRDEQHKRDTAEAIRQALSSLGVQP